MKPKLIILTDLWGISDDTYLTIYLKNLESIYEITVFDSCSLGDVQDRPLNEDYIHQQFVDFGIETATNKIVELITEEVDVLAFSVGGTIAWKAILQGLKVCNLFAISSTRLRKETQIPQGNLYLWFGNLDTYKPNDDWFEYMNVVPIMMQNCKHDLYRDKINTQIICKKIIRIKRDK